MDNKERVSNQGGENGNEWKVLENAAADFNPDEAQRRADVARAEKAAEKVERGEKPAEEELNIVEYPKGQEPVEIAENCYFVESPREGYEIAADKDDAPVYVAELLSDATRKYDMPKEFETADQLVEMMKGDKEQREKVENSYNKAKAKLEEIEQKLEGTSGEARKELEDKLGKDSWKKEMQHWEDRLHVYAVVVDDPHYEVVKKRYEEKNAENTVKILEDTLNTEQEQLARLKLGGKAEIDGQKFSKKELKNRIKEREKELDYARATLGAARANFAIAQNAAIA